MAEPTSMQALITAKLPEMAEALPLSPKQWQVCHHIQDCRTEAMGGAVMLCEACGVAQPYYHSCRDRHCPRCQYRRTQAWCDKQRAALLPLAYHHLVFTLPEALNGWIEVHPERIYALLFETVWATLSTFAQNRHQGKLGMSAVLHTWGQTLVRHVHLHCLIPGGVLCNDGSWQCITTRGLFPVRALSRHFRGGLVSRLRKAFDAGELSRISGPDELQRVLDALMAKDWVVFSKRCITHTESVIDYLGRYTHRIAISDRRLSDFDGESVTLAYKDYRDGGRNKHMRMDAEELIRRFLLHVLPKGFMRVRHFGFLANRCRTRRLAEIRVALAAPPPPPPPPDDVGAQPQPILCPICRKGRLHAVAGIAPRRTGSSQPRRLDGG